MKIDLLQQDDRGMVWRMLHDNKEYIVQQTFKGKKRGGDYHRSEAHFYVLDGRIKLSLPNGNIILSHGESAVVPPKKPHYYEAVEDSTVMEFRDSHDPNDRVIYPSFRKVVFP